MFVHEINNHSLTEGGYFLYERTLMKERSQIRLDYLISVSLKPDESGSADAWTAMEKDRSFYIFNTKYLVVSFICRTFAVEIINISIHN